MTTNNFIQLLIEQLNSTILEELKPLLQEIKNSYQPIKPNEYMSRKDVCMLLGINLSTLWSWTKKGKLKSYGIGNRVYYKRSEIDAAIFELKHNYNNSQKKLGL